MVVAPLLRVRLCLLALECVVDIQHGKLVALGMRKKLLHLVCSLPVVGWANKDLGYRE